VTCGLMQKCELQSLQIERDQSCVSAAVFTDVLMLLLWSCFSHDTVVLP
jgi:hypothetical protein